MIFAHALHRQAMITQNIESFLKSIRAIESLYSNITFRYVAAKKDGKRHIIQGVLFLTSLDKKELLPRFESDAIEAAQICLSQEGMNLEGFCYALAKGKLQLKDRELLFKSTGNDEERIDSYYTPFYHEGLEAQNRVSFLSFKTGHTSSLVDSPSIDWDLMSATPPYGSLQELSHVYDAGLITTNLKVDIIAPPLIAVESKPSFTDDTARIGIRAATNVPENTISLGYSIHNKSNQIGEKGRILGSELDWETIEGNIKRGTAEINVSQHSSIHCFASMNDVTYHHWWVHNPAYIENPRKAAYEAFDENLALLKEIVEERGKKTDARDLESAVAWMLWMLGFSCTQLDVKRQQHTPDLIACTPDGNFLVIECTTGILKADSKLSHLQERTELVKEQLEATRHNHVTVLPVIVTTRYAKEIRSDLSDAHKQGIAVITRETLLNLVQVTLLTTQNPIQLFNDLLQDTMQKLNRHRDRQLEFPNYGAIS